MRKSIAQRITEVPAYKDYRKKYYNLIQRFLDAAFKHYGQKLVSKEAQEIVELAQKAMLRQKG